MSSDLIQGIQTQSKFSISQAISLVESGKSAGSKILSDLFKHTGYAYRIGITGPPGSGKGTQADNIVKNFNSYKISTGDLLRVEMKKNTDLGKEIKTEIDRGSLVSDDIINNLIVKILSSMKNINGLIFDGYPRNLNQAKSLDILIKKNNKKISCVISLDDDKETVKKRKVQIIINLRHHRVDGFSGAF